MSGQKETTKKLSEIEKAVITYAVFENINDWPKLYGIFRGEEYTRTTRADTFATMASRWKLSHLVRSYYEDVKKRKEEQQREAFERLEKENICGDSEPSETKNKKGFKNLLDRDEFLRYLNDKVNELSDPNSVKDFLKLISDNMRYKENRSDKTNEIQRFYTPLTCKNCPLYKKEQENTPSD